MSITAHMINRAKSIKGIRCDPHNTHVIATFSDYLGEPVKIWDLRKVAAANTKLANQATIVPYIGEDGQFATQSSIVDIAWSPMRQNLLGIATTQSKTVSFYDTCRPSNSNTNTAG